MKSRFVKGLLLVGVLAILGLSARTAFAKNYFYDEINIRIRVNKDSSFDVEEMLTFDYDGAFNQGWRSIPLKGISYYSNIRVIDGATGQPLTYSPIRLDKLSSSSWGKYTTYRDAGNENIEWYYSLQHTKHIWILKYKVHGGVGFFRDHDEIYWNLFSGYDVPVNFVSATVTVEGVKGEDGLQTAIYPALPGSISRITDGSFYFQAQDITAGQPVTIVAGWPKGYVEKQAFWLDLIKANFNYLISGLIFVVALFIGFGRWWITEKINQGRGVIVAEYTPPQALPPAMMEVIVREHADDRVWPATIVDLAVRGFIKIKEETKPGLNFSDKTVGVLTVFAFLLIVFVMFAVISPKRDPLLFIFPIIYIIFLAVSFFRIRGDKNSIFKITDFILEKNTRLSEIGLYSYEKQLIDLFFSSSETVSFRDLRKNYTKSREIYDYLRILKRKINQETEEKTGAFIVSPNKDKVAYVFFGVIILFIFLYFHVSLLFAVLFSGTVLPFLTLGVCVVLLYIFWLFEVRLSKEGQKLKEACLGFKLYLETAEKYRLESLTPETFEKYLPYAMIFGIEKKWASAFRGIQIPPPSWYIGDSYYNRTNGTFAIQDFRKGFSASFSSIIASAVGSHSGSGFGGAAGGGGGGGSGGAS